jgi:2'-deoxynucleoside 5'-phosphate N-hydrolase
MATIYFSGSISGGREDVPVYRRMVDALEAAGHRVIAGAVASETIGAGGEALTMEGIFARDMAWIDEAAADGGVLVAEVSRPSTGVGYEIGYARYRHQMRVICLYRPAHTTRCTAMISGDAGIELIEYPVNGEGAAIETLKRRLDETRE